MNRRPKSDGDFTPNLDTVLPNGKKVRDCTFGEVAFYGHLFLAIGHHKKALETLDENAANERSKIK